MLQRFDDSLRARQAQAVRAGDSCAQCGLPVTVGNVLVSITRQTMICDSPVIHETCPATVLK